MLRLLVGPHKGQSKGTVECRKQCAAHQLCGKAHRLFLEDVSYNTPVQADGHANAESIERNYGRLQNDPC